LPLFLSLGAKIKSGRNNPPPIHNRKTEKLMIPDFIGERSDADV
jgi:hypothetical protein